MTHGKIGAFNSSSESWSSYSERLKYYFEANDIANEKKRAIFLTACGPPTFQLCLSLVQPKKLDDVEFPELIQLLTKHFDPTPSMIIQRFKFHTRERGSTESVATYTAELKAIGSQCKFGDSLNEMIRDRLVCGINDSRIQRALLQEPNLTYNKAMETALSIESASKDVQKLNPTQPVQLVQHGQLSRAVTSGTASSCYRCGGNHLQSTCRFKSYKCRACGKQGHIAKVCRSSKQPAQRKSQYTHKTGQEKGNSLHSVSESDTPPSALPTDHSPALKEATYHLFSLDGSTEPLQVKLKLNNTNITMEIDTGGSLSLINEATYDRISQGTQLQPSSVKLRTYTGENLSVLGSAEVKVEYESQQAVLPVVVVQGNGPNLFGRNWMLSIRLNWNMINAVTPVHSSLEVVLQKHSRIFKEKIGLLKGVKAKIHMAQDAKPQFFRPRPVSYFLHDKVNQELQRLQDEDIIAAVQFSDWAAPIVPVLKSDGHSVRICGDYKVTVNQAAKQDSYPLPRINDLFANLSGGQVFSKLDLTSAYQQIELDEESKKYTTINTPRGLFHYNRLPFGISSAPSIFQRVMESLLGNLPGVSVYLDDILVSGTNHDDHLRNLDIVLERLETAGLTLKKEKCAFGLPSVEYLGHIIDKSGLHPSPHKVRAIKEAPAPRNISELKSFIGLVNYYNRFLSNLSTLLSPLYRLLRKGVVWRWTQEQQEAFDKTKNMLQSLSLLVHFDVNKELIVSADASPFGIGGVLSHRMADGTERPIAFTSRSLSPAEKKYCQLEKEGLAIVFTIKKFHQFLQGRPFQIVSDHQPLKYLFDETRQIPVLASARIQRWALLLSNYRYTIQHRPGVEMAHADAMSRLPLPDTATHVPQPGDHVFLIHHLNETPITAARIKKWTDTDTVLSRVRRFLQCGWTEGVKDSNLDPYRM